MIREFTLPSGTSMAEWTNEAAPFIDPLSRTGEQLGFLNILAQRGGTKEEILRTIDDLRRWFLEETTGLNAAELWKDENRNA